MKTLARIAMFALLALGPAACLATDEAPTGDPIERDVGVAPDESGLGASDTITPEVEDPEQAAACCIEGDYTCSTTGMDYMYRCATRVSQYQNCVAHCAGGTCTRYEINICD